jgi:hypothetical protein
MARTGSVQLLDVTNTEADLEASPTLNPAQKAQIRGALSTMRDILSEGPTNSEAGRTMEWLAALDPFARARSDLMPA